MSDEIKRCETDNPNRCKKILPNGQCPNLSEPNTEHCKAHGHQAEDKGAVRNYCLHRWQSRLSDKKTSPDIKSLRDEIGILRIMLEDQLNSCEDSNDLIVKSAILSDLTLKIEKLVTSCHRLENSMGQLLDKQILLQFANEVIGIITSEVTDKIVIDNIATKIISALDKDK